MKRYELSRQKNIRDIGGYIGFNNRPIKYGRIYRGGSLYRVNDEDVEIINSLHLTDIVDFRSEDEFIYQPDYPFEGVATHNFPAIETTVKKEDRYKDDGNLLWFIEKSKTGFEHMMSQYQNLIRAKSSQKAFSNLFELLLSDNKVIYFHCSQGKDRAGLASYFIESALGVDEKTKLEDYLLSNEAMKERVERILVTLKDKPFYDESYRNSLFSVFAAREEYLYAAIKIIDEEYGGMDNYLRNILHVDIEKLREMYLE